jgi:UDP-N-acetylmuramoyl-tripeptide--D-alanyl-D-alanine ligase
MSTALKLPLRKVFDALTHAVVRGPGLFDPQLTVQGICTDSRKLVAGDLFVALAGEQFDGHVFVNEVMQRGAVAAIVEEMPEPLTPGIYIQVPSSLGALAQVAKAWRAQFDLPVIAVAGSNGKTTVKEMIASVLTQKFGEQMLSTQGNLNNEIGVPQTLMRLRDAHRAAVIEMGMNHPGEMQRLSEMVMPTVGLVNNAQREHQEFMKTVEATAHENAAVIRALSANGTAVFPADDPHTALWNTLAQGKRVLTFGLVAQATVSAAADAQPESFDLTIAGTSHAVRLNIVGQHNVRNALAAAACCHAIGIEAQHIVAGLQEFRPVKGRLVSQALADGSTLIDDTYNANPDSVLAAIDLLKLRPPAILVLGDMGEVGDQGPAFHAEVGVAAAHAKIRALFTLGQSSSLAHQAYVQTGTTTGANATVAKHSTTPEQVAQNLAEHLEQHGPHTVLVKGSRSMRMERVIAAYSDSYKNNSKSEPSHAA